MRIACLVAVLVGCQPRGEPSVAPVSNADAASDADADTASDTDADTDADAEPDEPRSEIPARINEDYRGGNAHVWSKKFEHDGREVHDRKRAILRALALQPGDDIADVGAGSGLFTIDFAKAVGPKGTVFAVDVQDYFLEHLADKAARAYVQNTKTVLASQRSPNLADASVDVAFMCDSYHHVEYPKTYLRNLHAAIRPGGRLVVIDFEAIPGKSEKWILDHVRATPDAFKAEIEQAGFAFARAHEILDENFFFEFTRKPDP